MSTASLEIYSENLGTKCQEMQKRPRDRKAQVKKGAEYIYGQAIEQGNMEGAKIYAENAIRKKNEEINFLRLSSRIDAVASRVQTAVSMRSVTNSMASVVKNMDSAMQSMNLEKISSIMDKFESQFENLDVQSQYMETAMGNTTTTTTPADQVASLMQQVADAHGLELNMQMGEAPSGSLATANKADDEELNARLAKLRNM